MRNLQLKTKKIASFFLLNCFFYLIINFIKMDKQEEIIYFTNKLTQL